MAQTEEKYLILCVDRDDDLGSKARVESPVVGRKAVVEAATKLALADPEEADANAIFAAVKKYDELVGSNTPCEVAVVCGDADRGFQADRRIGRQVKAVVQGGSYTGVVLVSDGGEDEQVIPVIQSQRPIVSVQRVTVKHSQTVEETYEVLGRYLRMLVFDPHYSKYALGVPGLIFVLAGILIVANRTFEAGIAALLIIGGAFLVRGFSIDRNVTGLLHRGPTGFLRFFSLVAGIIMALVGILTGYGAMIGNTVAVNAVLANPANFLVYGGVLAGDFIGGSIDFVWGGIAINAAGALLSHLARGSTRWNRDVFVLVMLAILYLPLQTFSAYLVTGNTQSTFLLVSAVLVGLAAIFAFTTAVYPRVRIRGPTENE